MGIKVFFLVFLIAGLVACGGEPVVEKSSEAEISKPLDPEDARNIFILHCESCHGIDGKKGFSEAADLSVSKLSDEEIRAMIQNGNEKGMMPYKDIITTDRELDGVVEFVKTLRKN